MSENDKIVPAKDQADSDMEEYRGRENTVEDQVPTEEEFAQEVKSESDYKVTEIQIQDDSKKRLSLGLQDCFSDKSEKVKPSQEQTIKQPETMVNYASVKQTIKKEQMKPVNQSVEIAAKQIQSKISQLPPRYTPVSRKSTKSLKSQKEKSPVQKKPRVPSFRKPRKSELSDILPKPIGGGDQTKEYKRPMTAQERKIERGKKEQKQYLHKTQKLNQDLKGVLRKPKVERNELKQIMEKTQKHIDKARVLEKKRMLQIEAAKQKQVKLRLIEQQKEERKLTFLRPQSAKVRHTKIIEKEGKYTQDVSSLTNAKDFLDIALKNKRRQSHAVSVRAIKAVTAVEEVVAATKRNKSSLSPLYLVLQKREDKHEKAYEKLSAQLKIKKQKQSPKKYEKPKFVIEMERKKKKQMEELQKLAKQKLKELRVKTQLKDQDDALDVLDRVTRAAKRQEKKDALPDEATAVHDQEALLEQILSLKNTLNSKIKAQKKAEIEYKDKLAEAEELDRKMKSLALNKAVVDIGTKRFEKIIPTLQQEQGKRQIITTESPIKKRRSSEDEVTSVEKLLFFIEKQRLTGEEAFAIIDSNGDGVLSIREIKEGVIGRLGLPLRNDELNELVRQIDQDGDGVLTKHQFRTALESAGNYGVKGGRRVIRDVNVDRPIEIEEMLLDMKVKIKYMKERLPELKKMNSFQDPELKVIAKQIISLQAQIQNQKNKYSADRQALLHKIASSSERPQLIEKLLTLRARAEDTREHQSRKIRNLEQQFGELKHESSQLMHLNLLLKGQKNELKEDLRHLQIRHKMSRELNINFTRELRGFVQRSELDFKQLFDIQEKQIIEVDYKKEEEYRRKAAQFLSQAYVSQKRMAVNTLKGLRSKAALWTLKEYYHEKWEMKRNKAERMFRAVSFLVLKGVQLKEKCDQKKRVKERERRKQEQKEKKNTPQYKAAQLIATTWKQKRTALLDSPGRASPRKEKKVIFKQLEVMCSQCSKKADIECVECAKPFCESCYDTGHRSGFRRQHEFKNIVIRRKKKVEESKEEEQPSLFSKPLKTYHPQEFMREFEFILKELKMDIQEIIVSKIEKQEMEQEGESDIITTAQLYTAIRLTVHQLKEPEILKYINLVYKECSWHPQKDSQWRYYIDCKKLFSSKRQN